MLLANTVVALAKRKYVVVVVAAETGRVVFVANATVDAAPLLVRFTVILPNLDAVVAADDTTAVPLVC